MAVIFEAGYALPGGDEPLGHARIAHKANWLSGGTVTASSTATDYFADAPAESLTYEKWKGTAAATWEYDHGGASECDYCVIGAHTFGTDGATFDVEYWNGATWVDLVAAQSVGTNEPIMVIFEPVTAQRWRVNITAGTPEVGIIKFGKALQMQRPLYGSYTPPNMARQTQVRGTYSESGEFLGRTKQRTYLEFPLQWSILTRSWCDANLLPALKAFECEPFFVAPIPSTYTEVTLCQTTGPVNAPEQQANGYLSFSMSVRGYGFD